MFSGIILLFVFWLPESPRWLYCKGRFEKAKEMLIEYHGNGNPESAWVSLELREYEDYLELNGTDKKWWDYRALFNTRAARYRMMVNIVVSLFGQWAGNCTSNLLSLKNRSTNISQLFSPTSKAASLTLLVSPAKQHK